MPESALNVSRTGKAQLLQCRRRQAGLITVVAEQDDMITELWCAGMAELAGWVQPPFQDVSGDYERSGDDAVAGDLRIRADVDQGGPGTHCVQRLSWSEPGQAAPRICQQIIDRGPCHGGILGDPRLCHQAGISPVAVGADRGGWPPARGVTAARDTRYHRHRPRPGPGRGPRRACGRSLTRPPLTRILTPASRTDRTRPAISGAGRFHFGHTVLPSDSQKE